MRLRTFVALPALFVVLLISAAPAAYASYGGDGGINISNPSPDAGASVSITSDGWQANSDVTIVLHSTPVTLATVTADGNGVVDTSVVIPSGTAAGAHTIELTGTDPSGAPRTVSTDITVGSGGGSSLPRTGAAIGALLGVAAILFVAGTALSRARRRAID